MLSDIFKHGQLRTERAARELAELIVSENSHERVKAFMVKN